MRGGMLLALGLVALAPTMGSAQNQTYTKVPVGTTWRIDPAHSEVGFRVRHLVGRVRGQFTEWEGTIVTNGADWSRGTVNVVMQTASIDTRNSARDEDLRSPRFFAADSYPQITFESTGILAQNNQFEMSGLLTMKGRTRPVVFRGEYRGGALDQNGKDRIAFDGTALINRRDFGLSWNRAVDNGTLLGDAVEIEIAVEAVSR